MRVAAILFAASAIGLASTASASPQPTPQGVQDGAAKKPLDLNEMVCERQAIPGSRLAAARVCHTRAEWADLKGQDRQELERVQVQRGMQK
jgi:hypothetical protein